MKIEEQPCLDEKTRLLLDWGELRNQSLQPGGFGERRIELWPQLLGVKDVGRFSHQETDGVAHRDEGQIRLDTDRSFVMYPFDDRCRDSKENMQEKLHDLLVSVFRKRPQLSYFQGYHDIATVIFLTLPPEVQFLCVEKLSLHRLRDSMGSSLEPVLGLLKVTKNLVRLVDPAFADILERTSPLPFYALSNLLTLFSHDMPTLSLIQHVFDYVLCRPPIFIVYLATSIILSRRADIIRLDEGGEGDEDLGLVHSLLSSLPPIIDSDGAGVSTTKHETSQAIVTYWNDSNPSLAKDEECMEQVFVDITELHQNTVGNRPATDATQCIEIPEPPVIDKAEISDVKPEMSSSDLPTPPASPLPASVSSRPSQSPVLLTALLAQADALHILFPPTHPELRLSSIMGPQSVVYTWSESFSALPDDDKAEVIVSHPEFVVYPDFDKEEQLTETESAESEDERRRKVRRRRKPTMKIRSKLRVIKHRLHLERRNGALVAGAVVVLAVAVAVYGSRMPGVHSEAQIYDLHLRNGLEAMMWKSHVVLGHGKGELQQLTRWFVSITQKVCSGRQGG